MPGLTAPNTARPSASVSSVSSWPLTPSSRRVSVTRTPSRPISEAVITPSYCVSCQQTTVSAAGCVAPASIPSTRSPASSAKGRVAPLAVTAP